MSSLRRWIAPVVIVLATVASACAHGRASRPESKDQYLILAAELETTGQSNLYDAVRRLRPAWFTKPTPERITGDAALLVYVDDQMMGNAGALRRFPPTFGARIRYLSPTEAQVRYGQNNGLRAAILVETDRR